MVTLSPTFCHCQLNCFFFFFTLNLKLKKGLKITKKTTKNGHSLCHPLPLSASNAKKGWKPVKTKWPYDFDHDGNEHFIIDLVKIFEVPLARLLKFEEAVVVARLPTLFTPPTYAWLNSFVFFPPHLLALISCRRFIFERYDCMISEMGRWK